MAIMLSNTYQALKAAGAPEEKAEAAAKEIAGFYGRLLRLEVMVGVTLAGVISVVVKVWGF